MNQIHLNDPITKIYGIGQNYAQVLEYLQVRTIEDILYYFPYRYEDSTEIVTVDKLNAFENQTVKVSVKSIKNIRTRSRKIFTQAKVYDDSGSIDVIWFNQSFLTKNIHPDDCLLLRGKLNLNGSKAQLYSPEYEVIHSFEATHLGRITPVYNLTEGIKQKWLRAKIKYIFDKFPHLFNQLQDKVPQFIVDKYELIDLPHALKYIHFPENFSQLEKAKERLGFDELFDIQVKLEKQRNERLKFKSFMIKKDTNLINNFLKKLTFEPTKAQLRSINEILADLEKSSPMNRLLEGDVGSGKTLVAITAALASAKSGYQVAVMAPTAVLANQHYKSFNQQLKDNKVKVEVITGGSRKIKNNADVYIGTQALLFRKHDIFKRLGLIIIDEQHRFGVEQRDEILKYIQKLDDKMTPHTLTMTATPIPRSIALAIFGDLDVSVLDELPNSRIPTETFVVPENKRKDSYNWIREKIDDGNVCFWICPLIEESEKLETKAVIKEFDTLRKVFPKLKVEMLHGKISPKEKDQILKRFDQKKTQILVSTSVVEVGIDIADANLIIIEGAERFGLAQLHQLRGRVGRRDKPSWCLLFPTDNRNMEQNTFGPKNYSKAMERLKFFASTNDGLKLAEYDLKSRGPGEIYGTRQSGIPNLKIARLDDIDLIKKTRDAAKAFIRN